MLTFKQIDISDKDWICNLLSKSDFMGAEYSFANNMAWRRLSDALITRYKDFYTVLMPNGDDYTFTFPAGAGDYVEVINRLLEYCRLNGKRCKIFGVLKEQLPIFQEHFSNTYTVKYLDDSSDYIYLAKDLATLQGRKFHSKRNHLKKADFYSWSFSELSEDDFEDCIVLSAKLYNQKNGYTDHSAVAEQYAIDTFFKYYRKFNLMGGAIRVDGKLVAYTIGEKLNSNTVVVHIEKADTDYLGMYALINYKFVNMFCNSPNIKYVNREEDLGLPNLRKAKRSYNPIFQVQKHLVEFIS